MAVDSLENLEDTKDKPSSTAAVESPSPPPPPRRRERDSRERRDNIDNRDTNLDRPPRREYYDRNLPREREYNKRRASLSPPPPVYHRDRRNYSPPPRRSPPMQSFKRPRRDEGGYDGRRGSPPGRGGYGGGDRRFGYNHQNGNDREIVGRTGYPDERPHGRYAGRPSGGYESGPSGWGAARGGYIDATNTSKSQREGLMSYKQFIQELEDDILPSEAERRYQEYKSEYITTQKRAYFNAHKDEEWLKDKYHPTNLLAVIDRRNDQARKMSKDFLLELQSGTVDLGPGINASSAGKTGQTTDTNSENEIDVGGKMKRHARGLTKETDFPKAHPVSSEPRRVIVDIEQAQALVRKLDLEKGIEDNILCRTDKERTSREKSHGGSSGPVIIIRGSTSVKGLEGTELLDTLLTYLWRIHGIDYYGLIETSEAKGFRHVRVDGKSSDTSNGVEWEKKLDSFWQERLTGQDPLEIMTAKEKIDAAAGESIDPYVRKIRDEKYGWKYGCGAKGCTKLFHAAEFVNKHLKLKHPELLLEVTSKVREDLYFQNYMGDEKAPGGTPIMQPSLLEKPQKRRLGPDNHVKDDRGRRARDNRNNGGERYDRADNQQSMDFQSNNEAQAGSNLDESMYDSFNGQGIHFPSDMAPPPVLMPVPGAGPLGPFVPAPPEVAMQMMREQGGPSPFEGGGRNGRPGSHLGGPAPIIALPPQFRQDPRRLRSYDDLDAPEDEVTVIDYRSL
ncbi:serrate RNA effector molecule-like [Apium graveolens]|uniref:serrate RNA effector molecule-like n=1 Tax=Apium graveolens TaxID=4045 RepID=UPI003D7BE920